MSLSIHVGGSVRPVESRAVHPAADPCHTDVSSARGFANRCESTFFAAERPNAL